LAVSGTPYTLVSQTTGNIVSTGPYTVSGTAIGVGDTGTISVVNGNVLLTVSVAANPVTSLYLSGNVKVSGTNLTYIGTNAGSGTIYLLSTPSLKNPVWTPVWTNTVAGNGGFTNTATNVFSKTNQEMFFILSTNR
jgi:hypothetical protein